jgi:hypothetical protein
MGVRLHPSKHCFLGSVACLICLTLAWPPVELSLWSGSSRTAAHLRFQAAEDEC